MSQLTNNLNSILSIKADIKSAIEAKGVDMTGISFPGYASKIGEIQGGGSGDFEVLLTQGESTSMRNISNSASFVGGYAFYESPNVQTVTLPNCDHIGVSAFYGCETLQTISLPVCKSVWSYAFCSCSSLQSVYLPMCSYIWQSAFYNCTSISEVNLPVCESIAFNAFTNCRSLLRVDLPECSFLNTGVFQNCYSLSSVNIPKCEFIGEGCFSRCSSLRTMDLPSCAYIASYAFYNCTYLNSVNLPVCSMINGSAFYGVNTASFTLGSNSVVSLNGAYQFNTNANISVYVPTSLYYSYITDTKWMSYSSYIVEPLVWYVNGLLGGSATVMSRADWEILGISGADIQMITSPNFGSFTTGTFKSCTNLTQASIYNWQMTESEVFMGCTSLETVSGSITNILGDTRGLFSGCTNLSSITFVFRSLGDYMFAGTALTSSTFFVDTNHIGDYVFQGCTSLTEIDLTRMSSVVSAGSSIFDGCTNLSVIYINDEGYKTAQGWSEYSSLMSMNTEPALSFENGLLYGSITSISSADWQALGITSTDITQISLPDCLTVGEYTFQSCYNLSIVYLPVAASIEMSAFRSCTGLPSIYLPALSSLSTGTFTGCKSLSFAYFPECTAMGTNVFTTTSMLSTIVLPKCSTIGSRALRVMSNNAQNTLSLYLGYSDVVTINTPSTMFFSNVKKHIYVPQSLRTSYEQNTSWNSVQSISWYNYEDSPYYTA